MWFKKVREFLNRNKIFFETITAVLLASMAVSVSYFQCKISKNQLEVTSEPRLLIEPSEIVYGSSGYFELMLINPSLAGVYDICIYKDYFVTETYDKDRVRLSRIGIFSILPDTTILQIEANDETKFNVDLKSVNEEMNNFYVNRKGLQMKILRLKIKYRRKIDGKEFEQIKAYLIAGNGNNLIDSDDRGITTSTPSFNEIKNIIGVKDN